MITEYNTKSFVTTQLVYWRFIDEIPLVLYKETVRNVELFPTTVKFIMFHSENTLHQIPFSFLMCNFDEGKHET